SQKVGIRFGETIKSYMAKGMDLSGLVSIPLAIAGWLRYLLAVDDDGHEMEVSSDPMKDALQEKLKGITFGVPELYSGQLKGILTNKMIFGVDLAEAGLAGRIETMFAEMLEGPGAVRKTLKKYLAEK
ncbi:MAG: mannitol dehydrogenase family protein, partial [Clostridia bacterium]|nr:mannitol dehydrogenase family protein [Clostridia bacterium]